MGWAYEEGLEGKRCRELFRKKKGQEKPNLWLVFFSILLTKQWVECSVNAIMIGGYAMLGTLTKSDIIDSIQRENGYSRKMATELVETLLELIKKTLASGEDVLVSGFGKFCVQSKKERRGRNPATGEGLILAPRKVVTFKCSGKLRARVNGQ